MGQLEALIGGSHNDTYHLVYYQGAGGVYNESGAEKAYPTLKRSLVSNLISLFRIEITSKIETFAAANATVLMDGTCERRDVKVKRVPIIINSERDDDFYASILDHKMLCHHPNILTVYVVEYDDKHCYVALEKCPSTDVAANPTLMSKPDIEPIRIFSIDAFGCKSNLSRKFEHKSCDVVRGIFTLPQCFVAYVRGQHIVQMCINLSEGDGITFYEPVWRHGNHHLVAIDDDGYTFDFDITPLANSVHQNRFAAANVSIFDIISILRGLGDADMQLLARVSVFISKDPFTALTSSLQRDLVHKSLIKAILTGSLYVERAKAGVDFDLVGVRQLPKRHGGVDDGGFADLLIIIF
ncbi:hypothetical protein Tco_0846758 [Tanacetum coccineum]